MTNEQAALMAAATLHADMIDRRPAAVELTAQHFLNWLDTHKEID